MAEGFAEGGDQDNIFSSTRFDKTVVANPDAEDWRCKLCTVIDKRLKMIQCDSCDEWFHFRCVGLTSYKATDLWVCTTCLQHNKQYKQPATCATCDKANDSKVIRCKQCFTVHHTSCVNIQDDLVPSDWVCDNCVCDKASVKTKCTTSSARAKANLKLQMLSAIKVLKDKKAAEELNIAKKFLDEQHERELGYILSKYQTIKDLDPEDDELNDTVSKEEDKSAVDVIKSKRLKNWLQDQNFSHLKSKDNPIIDKLSLSESKSDNGSKFTGTKQSHHQNQSATSKGQVSTINTYCNPQPPLVHPIQDDVEPVLLNRLQIAARQAVTKDLPHFYGDAEDWPIFISAYNNTTKICGYRDEENLSRLQKCLKGDARTAVSNFLTFPQGVPRVIETLRMLFGNEEQIFIALLSKIRKQQAPKPDDLMSLVHYSISVQNLCGTLETAGMANIMRNILLVQELVDKLPPQIKLNWGIYKINLSEVTLKHLSDWLYEIAKAACSVTTFSSKSHRQDKEETSKSQVTENKSKDKRSDFYVHQSAPEQSKSTFSNAARTQESSHSVNNVKKCCLCPNGSHMLNDCQEFKKMSSEQRWLTVKNHKLCRFCLGPHYYMKCKQRSVCGVNGCEFKHHPKLHQTMILDPKKMENPSGNSNLVPKQFNAHLELSRLATLRYIVVRVYNGPKMLQIVAFLD